jgi:hypothetical protein
MKSKAEEIYNEINRKKISQRNPFFLIGHDFCNGNGDGSNPIVTIFKVMPTYGTFRNRTSAISGPTSIYFGLSCYDRTFFRKNIGSFWTWGGPGFQQCLPWYLDNKIDKTRAIYIWITENIAYDVKKLTKKREGYKCKDSEDCRLKKKKNDNKIINRILKNKKGICSGYALLFHRMCNMANIESASINGYIKNSPSQVGKMGNLDHAWNTVTIDNQIYYLDLTWAAGGVTKKKKYLKNRNDYYWFTPIEKFSLNHFH